MATMTHDTGADGTLAAGRCRARLRAASRRRRSGCPARWPAACSTPAGPPGAVVLARIALAAAGARAVRRCVALRGRWHLLRAQRRRSSLAYGAGRRSPAASSATSPPSRTCRSAPALLIEYTAPVAVVVWLWLRHGQRPGRLTLAGAVLAALGLVLVLDLLSGADLERRSACSGRSARWSACATYFVISADEDNGLPPIVLAAGGLVVGARGARSSLGLVGVRADARRHRRRSTLRRHHGRRGGCRVLALGVVTAAAGLRHRASPPAAGSGSRLASFVALLEVLFARGVRLAAARRAAPAGPAARRRADPGRRGGGQARRAGTRRRHLGRDRTSAPS